MYRHGHYLVLMGDIGKRKENGHANRVAITLLLCGDEQH